MGDCKKCPFYKTEPVPEDLAGKVNLTEWSSCDVDAVGLAAADRIANQSTHIAALQQKIEKLRGQVPRWIPVTERLPENFRKVLCWGEYVECAKLDLCLKLKQRLMESLRDGIICGEGDSKPMGLSRAEPPADG